MTLLTRHHTPQERGDAHAALVEHETAERERALFLCDLFFFFFSLGPFLFIHTVCCLICSFAVHHIPVSAPFNLAVIGKHVPSSGSKHACVI